MADFRLTYVTCGYYVDMEGNEVNHFYNKETDRDKRNRYEMERVKFYREHKNELRGMVLRTYILT